MTLTTKRVTFVLLLVFLLTVLVFELATGTIANTVSDIAGT